MSRRDFSVLNPHSAASCGGVLHPGDGARGVLRTLLATLPAPAAVHSSCRRRVADPSGGTRGRQQLSASAPTTSWLDAVTKGRGRATPQHQHQQRGVPMPLSSSAQPHYPHAVIAATKYLRLCWFSQWCCSSEPKSIGGGRKLLWKRTALLPSLERCLH